MDKNLEVLLRNWQKRNIQGIYCEKAIQARDSILELIPVSSSVGISGSKTLEQIGIVKALETRGNKVFNPYLPGLSREESLELRKLGATQADYYLASPNAIAKSGELVFFSAFGNRISGVSYAKNVIIVSGVNKIVSNLEEAIKRSREYATPLNCKRLNWQSACSSDGICRQDECFSPEYKRMCCQILIIEAEAVTGRLKIFVAGENLGY
ncbi:MAG: lactate utilization protein [Candidatus Omnitrophica bacterium]|nr:lactate utilization protein [Candidatus Omnitrophota bacterium]MBU1928419.1 lactate utilization protein [Candidatus Omnitrophota bacterium]MBU2034301.1 lactate utilization protein [Candidatus Omnitrophota bacterium]